MVLWVHCKIYGKIEVLVTWYYVISERVLRQCTAMITPFTAVCIALVHMGQI